MFDNLKKTLNESDNSTQEVFDLVEMAESGAVEDVILEDIAVPAEEEKKIIQLLDKIPGDDFSSDEKITDQDLKDADSNSPDPTIEDLLSDL